VSGLQLRFEFGFEGAGIWTVPLVSGTVRHQSDDWGQFPLVPTDLPQNPAEYAESWMAVELPTCVGGAIWSAAEELYFADHFSAVTLPVPPIDTGGAADLPPLYFVASPGSWAVVRHCYKTLCQPGSQKDAPHDGTRPIIQAALDGRPLIMTSGSSRPLLQLTNCRGVPVEGKLEAATDHRPLLEGEAAVIVRGQPVSRELDISFPDGEPRVEPIRVGLDLGPSQQQFVLPAVVWGRDGDCSTVAEGPGVWRTDNGQMTLRADAGFRGALRTLECNGVNQLHTSYPAPRALGWINPWHGGAYPFLFWFGDMILAQETFSARPTARTGATGLAWRGIETACDVAKKKHNWLRLETDFLTLPGSNITAIVCRAVNRSAAPMRFIGGISVWAAPGGQPDQITVRSEQVQPIHSRGWLPGAVERRPFTRRQGAGVPILTCGPWVAFANAAVGDALLLACAAPLTSIEVIMIERLAASAMIRAHWRLEPRESREFTVWLVHARTLEQALPYQALAELTEL